MGAIVDTSETFTEVVLVVCSEVEAVKLVLLSVKWLLTVVSVVCVELALTSGVEDIVVPVAFTPPVADTVVKSCPVEVAVVVELWP